VVPDVERFIRAARRARHGDQQAVPKGTIATTWRRANPSHPSPIHGGIRAMSKSLSDLYRSIKRRSCSCKQMMQSETSPLSQISPKGSGKIQLA
jgi:hypothetical protein